MLKGKSISAASIIVLAVAIMPVSCKLMQGNSSSPESYVGKPFTTESGLIYTIHKAGKGKRAQPGDVVVVHYNGMLADGSVFDNSFNRGTPIRFTLGQGQVIKGWDEGIALLNVGDSATLKIPSHMAYGEEGRPGIPPHAELTFDVLLVAIAEAPKPFDISKKDSVVLEGGVIMYPVVKNEQGTIPAKGQKVTVDYTGYLRNGKKFDSSVDRGMPITFPLGQGRVIKGWDVALSHMKTGEKARLVLPPDMAYGERGFNIIPPNATLVFDVELLAVE